MIIANKYEIINKISEGKFGIVLKGKNINTNEYVAIKIEEINNKNINTLKMEAKIYNYLGNQDGFPHLKWFGTNGKINYLVIDLLVYSLPKLIEIYNKLSLKSILCLGIQIITRLEILHSKLLIHRDIKPSNFMIKSNKLYLIDFGMCKRYEHNGCHLKEKNISNIIGTLNYVSTNVHNLVEPSRRDDIESSIYVIMYLFYSKIFWENEKDINNILQKKYELTNNEDIPLFIKSMLFYVRQLKFNEKPNYKYLINILEKELKENNHQNDYKSEWN